MLRTLTGGRAPADPDAALAGVVAGLGDVGQLAFEWAFGEVWARPQLSRRDRSLVVVAIISWLGATEELAIHVPAAMHHGLRREEVTEIMVQLTIYAGFPRAIDALRAAPAAFAAIDGAGGG